ncbi:MAG: heme ABC exporter ATP-binding protein CcmA [Gemmatimonadaceae bacterium]|nr:heme ABC exporter ATP-binding protein CcmA [Gemmatimonadaceae bacterium]
MPLRASLTPDHRPSPVVAVDALGRRYGVRRALGDVSLAVHAGECLALFGPNGAGKTTLLRSLAGLLRPSSGEVRLHGERLPGTPATRARVGLLSHHSMLYDALTVRENVAFAAALHGMGDEDPAIDATLARLDLAARALVPVRALSRGWQQRTSIARAIVHGPSLVLLDEPYTGLDVAGARALTALLRTLRDEGRALVLVTHDVNEGLELATHAAVLVDGRLVLHEPVAARDASAFADRYRRLTLGEAA